MALWTGCAPYSETSGRPDPSTPHGPPEAPTTLEEPHAPEAPAIPKEPDPIPRIISDLPARSVPADTTAAPAPFSLTASDGTGLRLVTLDARAVVQEPLAFTELHLSFDNPEDRTIEGRFTIDLPPGAAISRFAMKIGDDWQEGEVVERQRARAAYEDFLHRKQDPALMEKQAGNRFSARVFPIPARGRKDLIIAYSQELTDSRQPYRMPLAGLPAIERLDARVRVDPTGSSGATVVELHERDHTPARDLVLTARAPEPVMGLRHGELALARVKIAGDTAPEPVDDLTILFDTSASRGLDFAGKVRRLGALVDALREQQGDFHLRLAAFDQDMSLLFDDRAAAFGEAQLDALYSRRALGASDLARALRRAGTITPRAGRILLLTDGVTTAGRDGLSEMVEAVRALGAGGVVRLDAIVDGGLQDRESLEALTAAGLERDGLVLDGQLASARLAHRLRRTTVSDVELSVPGATWSWPPRVDGVQPGDQVLVYAQLPADATMDVVIDGPHSSPTTTSVPLTPVERPLLHRAWIGARIERLQRQHGRLSPGPDAASRQRLREEIIELSTAHRVLCDFTALLVLESESDYQRFNIDRGALTDILEVGPRGLVRRHRKGAGPTRSDPAPEPKRRAHIGRPRPASETAARLSPPPAPDPTRSGALAVGNSDGDVWGGLVGTEVGEAYGVGGLGLVGTGRGGGGTGEGTIGLGGRGLTGHGGGDWAGSGYGRGSGVGFGGRGRSVARVRMARAHVSGDLDRDVVRRIVRSHLNEVRSCFYDRLRQTPGLRGRLAVQFSTDARGRVSDPVVAESTLADARVGRCITEAIESWRFPQTHGDPPQIMIPFVFSPGVIESADYPQAAPDPRPSAAPPPAARPYKGTMLEVMNALDADHAKEALTLALEWNERAPGDMVAHLALGRVLQATGRGRTAARAYGSLIDLYPARADLRRHAGSRLEALGTSARLVIDTYAHAVRQRPDHPSGHRMLAYAHLRAGEHEAAMDAIEAGLTYEYPDGRFAGVRQVLLEDAGLIAAAWRHADPPRADELQRRARMHGFEIPDAPSTRAVMSWETDANDVDLHIRDARGDHAFYSNRTLGSGGQLYADVTTGYGPECFTIEGPPAAYPYRFDAHYYSRGPMGYGMGTLQIIEHDGHGTLRFDDRPFLIMKDDAHVALGTLDGPRASGS